MRTKILFLTLVSLSVVFFASCNKDDGDEKNKINIPSQVSVKVGSSVNLGSIQSWQSSRTFVATVTNEGLITGKHVGTCTVSCNDAECEVNVSAATTLFKDPVTEWGASKSSIIAIEGTPSNETDKAIVYQTDHYMAPIRMYTFDDNGKLSGAVVAIKIAYAVDAVDHIVERYLPIGEADNTFYFINGNTREETTTIVGYQKYNSSYYWIMYIPNNNSSKGIIQLEKITEQMIGSIN